MRTPDKHKAKKGYFEIYKKNHWISPAIAPAPSWHNLSTIGRKCPTHGFSLRRGEKSRIYIHPVFQLFRGLISISVNSECWKGSDMFWIPGDH